jgi:hypothetical protein
MKRSFHPEVSAFDQTAQLPVGIFDLFSAEPTPPPKNQPNPPQTQAEKDREKQQQQDEKKREEKPPPQQVPVNRERCREILKTNAGGKKACFT